MTSDSTGAHEGGTPLPGSRACIGCGGLTFRQRPDELCPRCAFEAETLVERIEVDALEHDLQLLVEFDAYCRQRDVHRERMRDLATHPVFPRAPRVHERGRDRLQLPPVPTFGRVDAPEKPLREAS